MSERTTTVLGVRFTAGERAQIDAAATRDGKTTAAWVRHAAMQIVSAREFPPAQPAQHALLTAWSATPATRITVNTVAQPIQPFSKADQTARSPKGATAQP